MSAQPGDRKPGLKVNASSLPDSHTWGWLISAARSMCTQDWGGGVPLGSPYGEETRWETGQNPRAPGSQWGLGVGGQAVPTERLGGPGAVLTGNHSCGDSEAPSLLLQGGDAECSPHALQRWRRQAEKSTQEAAAQCALDEQALL